MEISKKREGNQLTITLAGELNTATAPDLEEVLADEVKADDIITFDMTELDYMTSAGLRLHPSPSVHPLGGYTNTDAPACR